MNTNWRQQLSAKGWNALRYILGMGQKGGHADVYECPGPVRPTQPIPPPPPKRFGAFGGVGIREANANVVKALAAADEIRGDDA